MQITLQNTEKGQCYAVRFDRYRQQVVDKLKTAVSVREALRTRQLGRERV